MFTIREPQWANSAAHVLPLGDALISSVTSTVCGATVQTRSVPCSAHLLQWKPCGMVILHDRGNQDPLPGGGKLGGNEEHSDQTQTSRMKPVKLTTDSNFALHSMQEPKKTGAVEGAWRKPGA